MTPFQSAESSNLPTRARQAGWAEFGPPTQGLVVRFEIVGEEEWRERQGGLCAISGPKWRTN